MLPTPFPPNGCIAGNLGSSCRISRAPRGPERKDINTPIQNPGWNLAFKGYPTCGHLPPYAVVFGEGQMALLSRHVSKDSETVVSGNGISHP